MVAGYSLHYEEAKTSRNRLLTNANGRTRTKDVDRSQDLGFFNWIHKYTYFCCGLLALLKQLRKPVILDKILITIHLKAVEKSHGF